MLGVAPTLGCDFTPAEDVAGGQLVVILSDELWRRRFGGNSQVIGQAVTLGDQSRIIIGIMPPGFRFPAETDLWMPLALNAPQQLSRQVFMIRLNVLARLKPGVTPEAARADVSVILERQRQAFPQIYSIVQQVRVVKLSETLVGKVRPALLVLFGAVIFVLLIACANVANLLLARSAARQREMAIRKAVGAGRQRLVRQLLTESLMLSVAGAAAGLLAAKWGVKLFASVIPPDIAPIDGSLMNGRVFGFTLVVAVLVGGWPASSPRCKRQRPRSWTLSRRNLEPGAHGQGRSAHGAGCRP